MTNKQTKPEAKRPNQETAALKEFFIDALKDIYWAEKNLLTFIPKFVKKASSTDLKDCLINHLAETENQVVRLEQVFASIDEKPNAKKCEAIEGMIKEADSIINGNNNEYLTRDVKIIAAAQKVEHYEIASYGTLRTIAEVLGFTQASELLNQTLEEEKNADKKLTSIAESHVNESSVNENH